jgi:hypothetical protein
MAQNKLKAMAEDLEKTLASFPPSPKKLATAAKPADALPLKPTKELQPTEDLTPLVRAIVEYSMAEAAESRTPKQIGEAVGLGISTAAKELNLSESDLVKALDVYLSEVVKSAKNIAR